MKNNKGFTLIEMLVVIAIIGLLSSVVLVALGPSRAKAKDARIISDLNQTRVLIETSYAAGKYNTAFAAPSDLTTDITSNGGTLIANVSDSAYAVASKLASDATKYYCIDSAGKVNAAGAILPASTYVCP